MSRKIAVIGGGFAGLSAACELANAGCKVTLFEKNETTGGRARSFAHSGFTFDMGPSWYWMPEVFQEFFQRYNRQTSDFYDLIRLDPSYKVIFEDGEEINVPANLEELKSLLEQWETGAGRQLDAFLTEAKVKYDIGMGEFVWKPSLSITEFFQLKVLTQGIKLQLLGNMKSHLRRFFSHPKILKLLEFPVLFLGAKPSDTPALYSLMNYADIQLGTWYPMGGMTKIPEAMTELALGLGVTIRCGAEVKKINVQNKRAQSIQVNNEVLEFDAVIAAGDYHHIETNLLDESHRKYSTNYWETRTMAPSSLIYYIGINKKIAGLLHHNLFFDRDFEVHASEIYDKPKWPSAPLFYACVPSKTDPEVAPEGSENIFILIPVAPGMESTEELREHYLKDCIERLERKTGESIAPHIVYKRSYAHEDFQRDYFSFKGNAYGLANTLRQTAFLKPRMKNNKVDNLYYAGQLTVPGPGVPPSIISGLVAANLCLKELNVRNMSTTTLSNDKRSRA
jgi:phytoene desaturase